MKVGIIGAGLIAEKMAGTIMRMQGVTCHAVAARDIKRAQDFAGKYNIAKSYGTYEDMVADAEIDLVYIATPHPFHLEHAKLAIDAGRAVLCEKPIVVNAKQARELFAYAEERNLLVADAIWQRYVPQRATIENIIKSGAVGEVKSLSATLGINLVDVDRLKDPELAGGALLDLGVYVISFTQMIMGLDAKSVNLTHMKFDTGVDSASNICITYEDGRMATLLNSALADSSSGCEIHGTKGYIKVENSSWLGKIEVFTPAHELVQSHDYPENWITGMEYEVYACKKALEENLTECPQTTHEQSLQIMDFMDELRARMGVRYPFET